MVISKWDNTARGATGMILRFPPDHPNARSEDQTSIIDTMFLRCAGAKETSAVDTDLYKFEFFAYIELIIM